MQTGWPSLCVVIIPYCNYFRWPIMTERRQVEQELLKREEQLSLALMGADLGTWDWNLKTNDVQYNERLTEMVGYALHEITPTLSSWKKLVHPDDFPNAEDSLDAHVEGKTPYYEAEFRMLHKSGQWVWVLSRGKVIEWDNRGRPVRACGTHLDITERKQAEEALQAREKKHRKILQTAMDGFILMDANGRLKEVNDAYCNMTGYTKHELLDMNIADLEATETPEAILARSQNIQALGEDRFETRHRRKDGDIIHVEVSVQYQSEFEECFFAFLRDITDKRRAENDLRESEAQFRAVAEHTSASIFLTDEDGTIIYWNKASQKIFGYTEKEILGHSVDILLLDNEKQSKDNAFEAYDDIRESPVFESAGRSYARRKDGTVFPLELTLSSWQNEGKFYFCAIIYDITELKKVEEQFRAIFNSSADSIIITDSQGTVISCNPATQTVFGYKPEELTGKQVTKLVSPEKRNQDDERFRKKTLPQPGETFLSVTKRKDGSELYVSSSVSCWEIAGQTFYSSINRDVTHDKKIEQQLYHSQKMEAVGTLAGGVAHDFNNILAGIMGYAELAKDKISPDSAAYTFLDSILKLGGRARDIVRQMLAYSRKNTVNKMPHQVHPSLIEQLNMLRNIIPANIEIKTAIDEHAGTVMADATQMQQVGMNLCTNAVHAMEETGGVLEITLSSVYLDKEAALLFHNIKPGNYVQLTVSDTGPGIEPDIIDRIFDPFFTTKETNKGTGLGLSVVDGIIRDHGGAISVESEPGKGTVFTVVLPVVEPGAADETEHTAADIQGGIERILIVDDEESVVYTMKEMLEHLGYTVEGLTDSIRTLERFHQSPSDYDLLITDLTMPGLTGDRLTAEVLAARPDIPVILMTGYNDMIDSERIKQSGVKSFIPKPSTRSELARAVRRVLDGQ